MKKELLSSVAFIVFPILLNAQIKAYPIDAWHSSIKFRVLFSELLEVDGRFTDFKGTILFNEANLAETSATIVIDVESIDTGVGLRDDHLRGDGFFDAANCPQILFTSKRAFQQDGAWVMEGQLDMHHASKTVQIPFEVVHGEEKDSWKNFRITLKGGFEINRLDYGIGDAKKTVGEKVEIELLISARVFNTETINLFERPYGQTMIKAIENGGIDAARGQYQQLKETDDKDTKSAFNFTFLCLHLKQNGNLKASLEMAKLGAEVFPNKSASHSLLGYAYYENGHISNAKDSFKKALKLKEQNTLALEMLKVLE